MLARRERRNGHFGVELVWRGDRHDMNGGIRDQRPPVRGRARESEGGGPLIRQVLCHFAEHGKARSRHIAVNRLHAGPGQRMAFAHEARADEPDADLAHVRIP